MCKDIDKQMRIHLHIMYIHIMSSVVYTHHHQNNAYIPDLPRYTRIKAGTYITKYAYQETKGAHMYTTTQLELKYICIYTTEDLQVPIKY